MLGFVGIIAQTNHFAHEDGMISCLKLIHYLALEHYCNALDGWDLYRF